MQNLTGQQHVQVFVRIRPTDNFAAKNIELFSNSKLVIHCPDDESVATINNRIADWQFR